MLARYQIVRGRTATELPKGCRLDVRKHVRHALSPDAEAVTEVLAKNTVAAHAAFAKRYRALLRERFAADRAPFDALAELARRGDVYLGCSCPTQKQPDVSRCHTVLALRFMRQHYPELDIREPTTSA